MGKYGTVITKRDIEKYKEIRGTIKKKTCFLGKYAFVITDGKIEVKVFVGKGVYEMPSYDTGSKLTVGYSGHTLINIRPGIVENED